MKLDANTIHIWSASLVVSEEEEQHYAKLLSPDEHHRAQRFRFADHQRRFIVTRAILRQILSIYIEIEPQKLIFHYNAYGKPALEPYANIQFNVSHSADLVSYAIAKQAVGIDIEKICDDYEPRLPERFFSQQECENLLHIPADKRAAAFYCLWTRKEAIIKATGKGLVTSLASFSVSTENISEEIQLANEKWYLQSLALDPRFAAALASERPADKLLYYNFPG